jgi:hypothetical protein
MKRKRKKKTKKKKNKKKRSNNKNTTNNQYQLANTMQNGRLQRHNTAKGIRNTHSQQSAKKPTLKETKSPNNFLPIGS